LQDTPFDFLNKVVHIDDTGNRVLDSCDYAIFLTEETVCPSGASGVPE
jgi:hypothetical protein